MDPGVSPSRVNDLPIRELYRQLLESWNQRGAKAMAGLFSQAVYLAGFDGSGINGHQEIDAHIHSILALICQLR